MRHIFVLIGLIALFGFVANPVRPAFAEEAPASEAPAKPPTANAEIGESAKPPAPEGGDKKGGDKDVSGGRFSGDPIYIHLTPMVLPVINEDGVEQLVTLEIALEVRDFDMADTVHSNMPRIRDALMQALYGGLGEGSLRDGHMVDVARVKAKATAALTNLLGVGAIRNVLIESIGQRML